MSHANRPTHHSIRHAGRAATLVLAALGCASLGATGHEVTRAAQTVGVAPASRLADLEKAFWACDHAATVQGVIDARSAVACGAVTEGLRVRGFNGDFAAMLSWWKRNKPAQHRALDEESWRAARRQP